MKGRKPKLRVVEDGEEENFTVDPAALGPCPEPPETLTNYHAQLEWLKVAPILHRQGRLDNAIEASLENYCVLIGTVRTCQIMIENDGLVVGGKKHPAFNVMNASQKEARLLAAELRLTRQAQKATADANAEGWGKDSGLLA